MALVGDLNDVIDSVPVRLVRAVDPPLYACANLVPESARFSTLHGERRTQIDHVLICSALQPALRSAQFFNTGLRDHGGIGDDQPTDDSDHALFLTRFATCAVTAAY